MNELPFRVVLGILALGFTSVRFYYQRQHLWAAKTRVLQPKVDRVLGMVNKVAVVPTVIYLFSDRLNYFHFAVPNALRWAGAGTFLSGLLLFLWTHQALGHRWSPRVEIRENQSLVVSGPYQWIRHPMYLSFFLIGIGASLLSANKVVAWSFLLPTTLFFAANDGNVGVELWAYRP